MRDDEPTDRLLEGWGAPAPAPDFAERVLVRVARPARRRFAVAFALGVSVGGLVVGAVAFAVVSAGPFSASRAELETPTHVAIPGVASVVGEPGARLRWTRRGSGEVVVEVERGIAWIRRTGPDAAFVVVADGDAIELASTCARVEVERGLLRVDVTEDAVACTEVEAAIARAEPSSSSTR